MNHILPLRDFLHEQVSDKTISFCCNIHDDPSNVGETQMKLTTLK